MTVGVEFNNYAARFMTQTAPHIVHCPSASINAHHLYTRKQKHTIAKNNIVIAMACTLHKQNNSHDNCAGLSGLVTSCYSVL